ncbi:hypothetical protein [Streptomyces sp. NPDC093225]|uniref:hypothetical protein n=1 Tax=Streptomyces sp. NPDC093225 TaxID=3366034 RepID=UPI00382EB21C
MNAWQADPYRFPGLRGLPYDEEAGARIPANPLSDPLPDADRRPGTEGLTHRRRHDLHTCLTVAGITPRDGDLHAIDVLCRVDDTTYVALRRWITGSP